MVTYAAVDWCLKVFFEEFDVDVRAQGIVGVDGRLLVGVDGDVDGTAHVAQEVARAGVVVVAGDCDIFGLEVVGRGGRHGGVTLPVEEDAAVGGVVCGGGYDVVGMRRLHGVVGEHRGAVAVDLHVFGIGEAELAQLVVGYLVHTVGECGDFHPATRREKRRVGVYRGTESIGACSGEQCCRKE